MAIEKKAFSVLSSDGKHLLKGYVYLPEGDIAGIFHVVHGMTEHIGRYDSFLTDMAKCGYIACGYDNLGHGYTANDDSELGYIADKDGWKLLAKDVRVFSDRVREEYGKDLPYYLMGHSMGSFIVRVAAESYVTPDKLVIMGTAGKNPVADMGIALTRIIGALKGKKHISALMDSIAFGSYNSHFEGEEAEAPNPWLTNDKAIRKKYANDKFCTFKFTVSAMGDLITLIKECNSDRWFKSLRREMPILLVSGEDDPVGDYGKGILSVRDKLKEAGADVSCILYKGARHEILNDFTYPDVLKDITDFLKR